MFFIAATSILLFYFSRSQLSKVVSLQSKQRQEAIEALREKLEDKTIVAGVKDNGQGFGSSILDGAEPPSGIAPGGSGTALMDAVASQVRGSILRKDDGGALIQLRCPFEA